jgi:predicted ATP-grasp superfamily ATP-dependent carboligase
VTGALVLGTDYRGLGAVQSLGRRGVEVWVAAENRRGVSAFSRYARRFLRWPAGSEPERVEALLELGSRHGLEGWVLFPTRDDVAAACARHAQELGSMYRLTTPGWETFRAAHDKRCVYALAAELGIPHPRTRPLTADPAEGPEVLFPSIIKPALREEDNPLTIDKAWPVHDEAELARRRADALRLLPADQLLLQELIPGDGSRQLSVAALAHEGRVLASVVARRVRQYPMDFGRASTFVETSSDPDVLPLAERLLAHLRFTGLVEIEFKRDPRTDEPKVLDVNPRLWGWHSLGRRAGIDFPYLMWQLANGVVPDPVQGRADVRWMWPSADVPTAVREILRGRLGLRAYVRSFRRPLDLATLCLDDPVPGLLEIPLAALGRIRRRGPRDQATKRYSSAPVALPTNGGVRRSTAPSNLAARPLDPAAAEGSTPRPL